MSVINRKKQALPQRLALSAAISAALLVGYGGRNAYAAPSSNCAGSGGTYVCSGTATTQQNLNSGANPLTITTTSGFSVNTNAYYGLNLRTTGSSLSFIDNNASNISADYSTIKVNNNGTGATNITSTGLLTTASDDGVVATNAGSATSLTINVADVAAYGNGVQAINNGTGATSVTSTGLVSTSAGLGIQVTNNSTATDLTIHTAAISAHSAITARNQGKGVTRITSTGLVSSNLSGIYARNDNLTTGLYIDTAAVTAAEDGIDARNHGAGITSISSSGLVQATVPLTEYGINAYNASTATNIIIDVAAVTGGTSGINLLNKGSSGSTTITSTGLVTGKTEKGIDVYNARDATDVIINTAAVIGGKEGIYAFNLGTGTTSITSTGSVTGTSITGINIINDSLATDLTINATAVTGGVNGISARNFGAGATNVTSTGTVIGTIHTGVYATTTTGNLNINTAAVTGGFIGVNATNQGSGATSITSTGAVTGTDIQGIYARNESTATDITINAAAVTGGRDGIFTFNIGKGVTSITSTGLVTSTTATGVFARAVNTASDITINTAAVIGGENGIYALNVGNGSTTITSYGLVEGTTYRGIEAKNGITASDITINTAAVTGGQYGIYTINGGNGSTTITSSGLVTGINDNGIYAKNESTASDLIISATDVTSDNSSIHVRNYGSGLTRITSTGLLTSTGAFGIGIEVTNDSPDTDIIIDVAAVTATAGRSGVEASNTGAGTTNITVNGAVMGGSRAGIYISEGSGNLITLNSGASVSAVSGLAIKDLAGDTTVTLNTGSSVTGRIELGAGSDNINLAGGDFTAVTDFNGGADTDSLIFSGSIGAFDSSLMTDIEIVTIDNGSSMGLTFTGNAFDASGLTNSLLTVQNSGILNATNGFSLTGNLVNTSGIVSLQNAVIDAPATINGNFTGGGTLNIDTVLGDENSSSDVLIITGDTSGNTTVNITNLGGLGAATTGNGILIVQVDGASNGTFSLVGELRAGNYLYNLVQVGNNWYLQSALATPIIIPTLNQWALALLAGLLAGLGLLGFKRRI